MFFPGFTLLLLGLCLAGWVSAGEDDGFPVTTPLYQELPGVTKEDIQALAKLQATGVTYVIPESPEAFSSEDHPVDGFSRFFAQWFSQFFQIPVQLELVSPDKLAAAMAGRERVITTIASGEFPLGLTLNQAGPIVNRSLKMIRLKKSGDLSDISRKRAIRYGFIQGSGVRRQVEAVLRGTFTLSLFPSYHVAFTALNSGLIDALVDQSPNPLSHFSTLGREGLVAVDFFPRIVIPVFLTSSDPALIPLLAMMEKALQNPDVPSILKARYERASDNYLRHQLFSLFTQEEKEYIRSHNSLDTGVPIIIENNNYPVSYFNENEHKYQGVAPDVIQEISRLTDIKFTPLAVQSQDWLDSVRELENGDASMLSMFVRTKSQEERFLTPDTPYFVDSYALLSSFDFPYVNLSDVVQARVGVVDGTAMAEVFDLLFPRHPKVIKYGNWQAAFQDLEAKRIDLLMATKSTFLSLTFFYSRPAFKINLIFNHLCPLTFAFNLRENVLCSIISKVLRFIDTEPFIEHWTRQVYDYRLEMLHGRETWLTVTSGILLVVMLTTLVIFLRKREYGFVLEATVKQRTRELEEKSRAVELALQQAQDASRAKSDFLAKMSHEIRTPMNVVMGGVEYILRHDLPRDIRDDAASIKQAGSNLLSIINDIIDFSKIEAGKLDIGNAEYEFSSLIHNVIGLIRMRLSEKQVLFLVNIDGNLPARLIGDEIRIRQVLLNILANAVKYTESGHIKFSITGQPLPDGRFSFSFSVTDTGIGINATEFGNLFTNFTRLDKQNLNAFEGTGLGLAISRHLCQLMGGDIEVESHYGEGSTFTIVLPQTVVVGSGVLARIDTPMDKGVLVYGAKPIMAESIRSTVESLGVKCQVIDRQNELRSELASGNYSFVMSTSENITLALEEIAGSPVKVTPVVLMHFGEIVSTDILNIPLPAHVINIAGILNGNIDDRYGDREDKRVTFTAPQARILLVDDIATNLRVAKLLLEPYESRVDCVKTGEKAIAMVQAHHYDVVFMDHMMPGMDGIEATRRIRELPGDYLSNIPIVALTANVVSGMQEMYLTNGFNDYLPKPIEVTKLDSILERWIPPHKRINIRSTTVRFVNKVLRGVNIEGLDIKRGLIRSGGSEKDYLDFLHKFCVDADERLTFLGFVPLEGDDFGPFLGHIHVLRNTSLTIGAFRIFEQASLLEDAGNVGDRQTIIANIERFQHDLKMLITRVSHTIRLRESMSKRYAKFESTNSSGVVVPSQEVWDIIQALRNALQTEKSSQIGAALNKLRQFSGEDIENLCVQVDSAIGLADFAKALRLLDNYPTPNPE
jgi:signal transduction histidine kinase/CheY-like chemotaxis protein